MIRTFTTKAVSLVLLLLLLVTSTARACDRSDLTYLGVTGPNLPLGPYEITVRLCVGMGRTGPTNGADQRTNSFTFAFWSSDPSLAISAFTPLTVTGPPTTVGPTCPTAAPGCTLSGALSAGPFGTSNDLVRFAPSSGCSGGKSYGCITSTCLCGPVQSYCTIHTFTTNVWPDSMRALGVEGAGNNVAGCYPDADMLIIFPPLPLSWGDVSGERTTTGVKVNWTTLQETNVDYFIVQRATDGVNYRAIGQIAAVGNTRAATQYGFEDLNPGSGSNVYRIMSVDRSGESDMSSSFEVNYFTPGSLTWGAVGPNPTNGDIDFAFYSPKAAPVAIKVFDLFGRRVMSVGMNAIEGGNSKQLDMSGLDPGSYFIHLESDSQKLTRRVMKL